MTLNISGDALLYIGAIVIIGKLIKPFLAGKCIGKVQFTKLLPIILLIFGEALSILGAFIQHTGIWMAFVSGIVYTGIAVLGYDAVKGAISKGI